MNSFSQSENNSAKKRARRENPWSFPVVLLFCALICLGGGAILYLLYFPRRFSEMEVTDYVSSVYGSSWTLAEKSRESAMTGAALYTFTDREKNRFTVYTMAVPEKRDGRLTGHWKKALYDDYFSSVIESRMEEIEALKKKMRKEAGLEMVLENMVEEAQTGSKKDVHDETADTSGRQVSFRLYLESSSQLKDAAKYIQKLDDLLGFSVNKDAGAFSLLRQESPDVHVYLCPEILKETPDAVSGAEKTSSGNNEAPRYPLLASWTGNWKDQTGRSRYEISRIPFSCNAARKYAQEELFTRLENDYADAARTFGKEYYSISEELWAKYPAPVLTLINVGGHDLVSGKAVHEYRLFYNRRTHTYWMTNLDPCEYTGGNGSFSALVEYLGGNYSCYREKEASWRIGTTVWKAFLETKKGRGDERVYKDLRVYRDGNTISLDPVPDAFEGTGALPSGRPFSMRDLIKMLDVHITVNQREMTAVIYRTLKQ